MIHTNEKESCATQAKLRGEITNSEHADPQLFKQKITDETATVAINSKNETHLLFVHNVSHIFLVREMLRILIFSYVDGEGIFNREAPLLR